MIGALLIPYFVATGFLIARPKLAADLSSSTFTKEATSTKSQASIGVADRATPSKPGPWGNLEYVRMYLEIPEEFLSVQADEASDRRWFFRGYTEPQVKDFFSQLGLSTEQSTEWQKSKFEQANNGVHVSPTPQLVFSLAPGTRQRIYSLLTQFPENNWQREAFIFPADGFDAHFADAGLPAETIALVKKLCYPHGKALLFADLPYVLATLPKYADKLRLEKAASRRATLLAKVHITQDSDINSLVSYWGKGGTAKDLRPLLESLSKVEGGARVGLAHLLPAMPTARLYTFPFPSLNQPENCHWTSFNFFKDPPEGRYEDPKVLKQKLDAEYYPVFSDPKYGDLVFLLRSNGDIVHSAVFIADNIVYTKNGGHFTAPWLLMTIPDVLDSYAAFVPPDESLTVMYYRNKYL